MKNSIIELVGGGNMKVLVTGADGFVGSYLCRELRKYGHEVVALVRHKAQSERVLFNLLNSGHPMVSCDIRNSERVMEIFDDEKPEGVVHLAAQSFVPYSFEDPIYTYETNITGTFNVLEAAKKHGCSLVFAGSSEEYGNVRPAHLPLNEDSPLNPVSPYALSKVVGDYATRFYANTFNLPFKVSRAFNHEGAGRGKMFVTSQICDQVAVGKDIELGNVNSFRDWSHVIDIVRGYIAILERGRNGEVYVQGSGTMHSVLTFALFAFKDMYGDISKIKKLESGEVIEEPLADGNTKWYMTKLDEMMFDALKSRRELFPLSERGIEIHFEYLTHTKKIFFSERRWRPIEVPIILADPKKMRKELGIRPIHDIECIINDMMLAKCGMWNETCGFNEICVRRGRRGD